MRTTLPRHVVLSLVMFLAAPALHGDTDPARARGFNAGAVYQFNDIDSINAFNGNLMLTAPIGPAFKTNGALQYQFRLFYNSNIWEHREIEGVTLEDLTVGPQYGQPRNYSWFDETFDPENSGNTQGSEVFPATANAGIGWLFSLTGQLHVTQHSGNRYASYQTGDGVWHPFTPRMHGDLNEAGTDFGTSVSYTRDGTYMRARYSPNTYTIDKADGTRERFVCLEDCGGTFPIYALDQISDAFGSVVHVVRTDTVDTYVESVGVGAFLDHKTAALTEVRQHVVTFKWTNDCVNRKRVHTIELASPASQKALYTFHYEPARILRSREMFWGIDADLFCPFGPAQENLRIQASLLTRIELPQDRTQSSAGDWMFDYIVDPRVGHAEDYPNDVTLKRWGGVEWEASYVSGRLYQTTLPTGGAVRYKYERRAFRKTVCTVAPARLGLTAVGVRERQVLLKRNGAPDGQPWRYFRGNVAPDGVLDFCAASEILSISIDPLGVTTASFFMATADRDWGQPFLRAVPDVGGGSRFLSSQVYQCQIGQFGDLNAKAGDLQPGTEPLAAPEVRRVVARYSEPPLKDQTTCGLPLRSTYITYENSGEQCQLDIPGDCEIANRRVSSEKTVFHDDGDAFAAIDRTQFDGFGHYRTETTSGNFRVKNFGSGNDQRVTVTNYNPGVSFANNALTFQPGDTLESYAWTRTNTYDLVVRTESGLSASTLYRFDPATGFLLRQRTLASPVPCTQSATNFAQCTELRSHDVLVDYKRSQSSSGETTIIASSYGGDRGSLSTTAVDLSTIGGSPEYLQKTVSQYGAVKRVTHLSCGEEEFLTTEANVVHKSGPVTESTDSSGAKTTFEYDALYRIYKIDPPGNDVATQYDYTPPTATARAKVTIRVGPSAGGTALTTSKVEWDHMGRVALESTQVPDANDVLQTSAKLSWYHPNGLKEYESTRGPIDGPNQVPGASLFKYDAFGRVIEVQHPDHETEPPSARRRTLYLWQGTRLVRESVKQGTASIAVTWKTYDRFGRLVRVNEQSVVDEQNEPTGIATRYEYDVQDHLVSVDSPNAQKRTFEYDRRGFLLKETHPELGGENSPLHHSLYDPRGNAGQLLYSAPNGSTRTAHDLAMVYDPLGRLLSVHPYLAPSNTPGPALQEFTYAQQPTRGQVPTAGEGFLRAGKLHSTTRRNSIVDPAATNRPLTLMVTESFSYDITGGTGRLNGRTVSAGGNTFGVQYAFNSLGLPSKVTHGALKRSGLADVAPPFEINYGYREGALQTISGPQSSATTYVTRIGYNRNGTIGSVVHSNGTRDTITPDPTLLPRVERITTTFVGSATYDTGAYDYDARGNITRIGAKNYTYDGVSRLVSAQLPIGTQTFVYDANGNPTTFAGTPTSIDPATNRLRSMDGWIAEYDLAGNLHTFADKRKPDVVTTFTWDALNTLTHVKDDNQGKLHIYSAGNERIATFDYRSAAPNIVETWVLRGLGNEVIRDFKRVRSTDGNTADVWSWNDYVYRGTVPVASIRSTSSGSETLHDHVDHLGSIRRVSNAAGATADHRDFYPFGQEQQERPDTNRLKFTGHERDDNGLTDPFGDVDYMHARYYNPMVGRFLSLDPGGVSSSEPQSWNRYTYARNNPLLLADPDGRETQLRVQYAHTEYYKNACSTEHDKIFFRGMGKLGLAAAGAGTYAPARPAGVALEALPAVSWEGLRQLTGILAVGAALGVASSDDDASAMEKLGAAIDGASQALVAKLAIAAAKSKTENSKNKEAADDGLAGLAAIFTGDDISMALGLKDLPPGAEVCINPRPVQTGRQTDEASQNGRKQ